MKISNLCFFTAVFCIVFSQIATAIDIRGGKLVDLVVADSGHTDSTFSTGFIDEWAPDGPNALDIDRDGNIYVLDQLDFRVQKFNKDGEWISTFRIVIEKAGIAPDDIAVDNYGNVYVVRGMNIMKFSPQGKFLLQTKDIPRNAEGEALGSIGFNISVDKAGRIYDTDGFSYDPTTSKFADGIHIYSPELKLEKVIGKYKREYRDEVITQKEASNDIYFRQDKYLFRTNLEEYSQSAKIDTVATLPDELKKERLKEELQKSNEEEFVMIGFDRDTCFYFYYPHYSPHKDSVDFCWKYKIVRYKLKKKQLLRTGDITMDFTRNSGECSKAALTDFGGWLHLVVSGDGTIYWIHGTVDTVKVSKITFDK